jgi:hypothetical protein
MDLSKLSRGQLIAGAGGIVLVLSLFLSWVSLLGASASAFDTFSGMDIIMLVIGLAAVAFAATEASGTGVQLPGNAGIILAVAAVVVFGWALGWCLEEPSAGFGAWLGLIASGAIAYGAWEAVQRPTPFSVTTPAPSAPSPKQPGSAPASSSAGSSSASAAPTTPADQPTTKQPAVPPASEPPAAGSSTEGESAGGTRQRLRPYFAPESGGESDRPGGSGSSSEPSEPEGGTPS